MSKQLQRTVQTSFGFSPADNSHHFLVTIPRGANDPVEISEHYEWDDDTGSSPVSYTSRADGQLRARLPRLKWDMIADHVRAQFNRRLKKKGAQSGQWKVGVNPVRLDLGKELVLLAWAIEDADPALIPNALANWEGLEPEERWWLFTQTAAASGHATMDRNVGWRKAVRYALTENPLTEMPPSLPEYFQRASETPLFVGVKESTDSES